MKPEIPRQVILHLVNDLPGYDLSHPGSVAFLQPGSFPALCRNSTGNTRLQGRVSQTAAAPTAHAVRFWTESSSRLLTRSPKNLKYRAPIIAVIVWNALCFALSTWCLSWSPFPGPGRIRTQRTDRLQKVATFMQKTKRQKFITTAKNLLTNLLKLRNTKQSIQTHPVLMFLILTPPSCLRPK